MRAFYFVIILFAAFSTFTTAQISANNLVAWWPLGEGTGTIAYDSSGNNHNGTLKGATWITGGVELSQNTHSIVFEDSSFRLDKGAWEVIINVSTFDNGWGEASIIEKDGYGYENDGRLLIESSTGKIEWVIDLSTSATSARIYSIEPIPLNTDTKIRAEWGASGMKLFINDILQGSNTVTEGIYRIDRPLTVGSDYDGSRSMIGTIKDIKVFSDPTLVAYYPFNENADDESGNENNGYVDGASLTNDRFGNTNAAYNFPGSGTNNIIINNNNSLDISYGTFCVWFSYNGEGFNPRFLCKGKNFQLLIENWDRDLTGRFCFADNGAHFAYSVANAPIGGWHFFVVVKDSEAIHLYLDGIHISSTPRIGPLEQENCQLVIGNLNLETNRDGQFPGILDDIRIYNRALTDQEIKSLYGNYLQQIVSVKDVPNDQGGKVRIKWDKIYLDSIGTTPQITSYGVWRKIPPGLSVTKRLPSPMSIMNDTLGVLYDYLGTVNATQSPSYNFVAQTLQDSSESGTNAETFLITAHTADPNVYYISDAAMGYSVDNIAPSAVTSLAALWQTGPFVNVSWNPNQTDQDFQRYEIYKSNTKNFVPSSGLRIGTSINPEYQDADVTDGYRYYYQVYSVDSHGNKSDVREVKANGNSIPKIISLNNNWNMVSIPMDMDDYSKEALFPTVVSSIFKFDGSYQTVATLENGTGYWAKFNYAQGQTHNGFYLKEVRINVKDGWNMIGSLSETVQVSNITSEPSGMVTSQIFGYNGSYQMVDNISPGNGYWIKVNGSGTLILSNVMTSSNRIKIEEMEELPPAPPEIISSEQTIPNEFILAQNYPNPFNPTTVIKYGLPEDANVTLSVFNTLGQEISLLINGMQKAGYHEVIFDGSELTSGVYFYRIQANNYLETKKLLLMK